MKPVYAMLIAIATLVAGGLAGYFIGHSDPAPAKVNIGDNIRDDADPAKSARQSDTKTTLEESATRQPEGNSRPVSADTGHTINPSSNGIAAWIAANTDLRARPGDGRIHGRVTTQAGEVVPGAKIKIMAYLRGDVDEDYNPDATVEKQLEFQARHAIFTDSTRATATTDIDGRYEFTGLGEYDFQLSGEAAGYSLQPSSSMGRYGRARPPAEVNFKATPMCEVEIDVLMPDGAQAKSATVHYGMGERNTGSTRWSPRNPRVKQNPGAYTFRATRGENEELVSDEVELDLRLGEVIGKQVFQLKQMASIVCTVKQPEGSADRGGMPFNRSRVVLEPTPGAAAPDSVPSGGDTRSEELWRGDGSEVTFGRLTPGTYRLLLAQGNKVIAWKDVAITTGMVKETLAPPAPEAKDYFIVRVLYHDGRPVIGGGVRADILPDGGEMRGRASVADVLTRADGSYWVAKPRTGDAATTGKWKYRLTGNAPEYGSFSHEHPGDGPAEATVNLPVPANLTLFLSGASAHPQKARIEAQLMHQTSPSSWSGVNMSGDGRGIRDTIKYGPIAPGTYRLTLRLTRRDTDDGFPWESELASMQFEVRAGENTQTCAVPMIYKLTLVIADPKTVGNLQLTRPDGTGRRPMMRMQVSERTVLDGLAAGDWIISSGNEAMKVTLNADLEIAFAPKAFDCVVLDYVKPGGKIEAMGLRQGDKVLRVDGQDGATAGDIQRMISESQSKESTTWTVQRAGGTLSVTFNGIELRNAMRAGGEERENFSMRTALKD